MASLVFLAGCPNRYSVFLMGVTEALLDNSGVPKLASVFSRSLISPSSEPPVFLHLLGPVCHRWHWQWQREDLG